MKSPRPVRTHFDRQLLRLQRDILRMGALVEGSCLLARDALFDRDLEASEKLVVHDKQVDYFYRQIELDCVNVLTLQAPVTQDLRQVSAFMQMVRDLERIGDYSKDIGEVAIKLFPYPVDPCMDRIRVMLDRCRSMVAMSLVALSNLDADVGLIIKEKDDAVDQDYEDLYNWLAHQRDVQGTVEPIVLMVLVIRYLERIADHATNVGRRVAFIVTGERV
ncbi:MAG: phosphate signaling complex protein PhoU [Cyanobacteria bacterium P01_A01_bin.123]